MPPGALPVQDGSLREPAVEHSLPMLHKHTCGWQQAVGMQQKTMESAGDSLHQQQQHAD